MLPAQSESEKPMTNITITASIAMTTPASLKMTVARAKCLRFLFVHTHAMMIALIRPTTEMPYSSISPKKAPTLTGLFSSLGAVFAYTGYAGAGV